MHKHRAIREKGPQGCAGNVSYTKICACGAQRSVCYCVQCRDQGTNDSGWYMPECQSCDLRHAEDTACQVRW